MDHRAGPYAEFEAFVAGAAGRLLHVAVLLTAEARGVSGAASGDASGAAAGAPSGAVSGADCPAARRLLAGALARTYAGWERLRGDDPYDHTRQELCAAFARTGRRHLGGRGVLAPLPPLERLVLVLCVYEGVAHEVAAAQLGLPVERVRVLSGRAVDVLRARREEAA
ncbi:sigma factor-like helix-turn-helix DNA-binding protein [Streptomyces sp. NPDC090445]|uniref:sigma factor-like helix-turn-helix DNA-binding protein n=1 Tax=Streptomyces sp. NPDC090445 TaxID=3365963 RepID=UPI00382415B1